MKSDAGPIPPEGKTNSNSPPWSEIKALFDSALELEGAERDSFLHRNCAGSEELRRELEGLLQGYDDSDDFLGQPVVSLKSLFGTAPQPQVEPERLIGTRIGAYRIEKELGRGGMGEVYLATRADSEFDQRVAIKLIRDGGESDVSIRRFRQERQILAGLENAYIARLIDGGTTSQGLPYFVMEYVEGQAITEYCEARSLTSRDRMGLFIKVCSAVQYAHERNIIHRDLKPGNILVKSDGTPKLLDFGIAKILGAEVSGPDQDATRPGFRILTPAYASPEQLRGGSATVRSDIYSLGIVLYELLCGRRLDQTFFYRHDADSLGAHAAHLSAPLRAVVLRSIHLDPLERYPSVEAFAADICRYLSGAPALASTPESLFAATKPEKIPLAILPFRILGDQHHNKAFLASGIAEVLITKLSRIDRLSIPPPSAVRKYSDGVEAVRAARELQVKYVLEGSIQNFGDSVRASVQLVFAEAGIAVWASQIDAAEKDLLQLEDSIAEQVAQAVVPHLTGEERAEIGRSGTTSGAAHAAYLRGRWLWSNNAGDQEKLAEALVCFMQAIAIDPKFARAHAGVADYYLRLGLWGGLPPSESFAAAIDSARRAVDLEPTLGEAHASLAFAIWAYRRDEETAEKHFTLATVRNPNYASAHHWFGLLNSSRNRPELAIANLERAQKVDPNSAVIAAALGFVYYNARQFDSALHLLLEAARELPTSAIVQEMLTWCHLQTGNVAKALQAGRKAVELGDRAPAALSALAHAEAAAGRKAAAAELNNEIEQLAKTRYVSGYDRASAFLATRQFPQALDCLEQALADRDWWLCWINVDPRWDPLRHESRFRKLLPQRTLVAKDRRKAAFTLAFLVLAIGSCLLWWAAKRPPMPFADLKLTKLTSNGTAESAAVSPDGTVVVYVAPDAAGSAIWSREMATGRVHKLVAPSSGKVSDLGFTARGAAVQFVTVPLKDPSNRDLFTVPLTGGAARHIAGKFPGPVSLSANGDRLAFYKSNMTAGFDELWTSGVQMKNPLLLASYKYPHRFAWTCRPAWSPDGARIAYAAEDRDKDGFLVRLYVVDTASGVRHLVPSPRWQWVQSVDWTGDKSALAVVGQEHESSFQQIWYVPYPGSEDRVRRIGNDLDDYFGASLTALSSEIVSVQSQTLSNIYIAKPGNLSRPAQITVGSGRYFDLCWMPDGRILYASDATGSADLWIMNADGGGQRQTVFGNARNYAPTSSPDSSAIAFHSNRSGNWQVWRADSDGTHPQQLSDNLGDGNWPQFTPDGKAVLFHRTGPNGVFNLWRVPAAGGRPVQITTALTMHPAVSRLDGKIAAWYSEKKDAPQWKIAVFSPAGGEPLRIFNPTPDAKPDTPLRWTPKGDAISFLDYARYASNIWLQPVDGRAPHPLTSFDSGEIYSFDWSRNGTLIYSRGLTTADVVLIRDRKAFKERK